MQVIPHEGKSKKEWLLELFKAYQHNWEGEGYVTPTRMWYKLKPQVKRLPTYTVRYTDGSKKEFCPGFKKPKNGKADEDGKKPDNEAVNRVILPKTFTNGAREGLFDDSFIHDTSRKKKLGDWLPHIVIVPEKDAAEEVAIWIAEKLGTSYYISGGQSSYYGAKGMVEKIKEVTDAPICLLVITDYDPSGFSIAKNIQIHFNGAAMKRLALSPHQMSDEQREGQDFGIAEKDSVFINGEQILEGEPIYELDALSKVEMIHLFLNEIPDGVRYEIEASYIEKRKDEIKEEEVNALIDQDSEIQRLREELNKRYGELYYPYESRFVKAAPIEFGEVSPRLIYDDEVTYEVGEW